MQEGVGVFIRIIPRFTCDFPSVERRKGPTRSIPHGQHPPAQTKTLTAELPTLEISMDRAGRCWYKPASNSWTLVSLLDRGPAIWQMYEASCPSKIVVRESSWSIRNHNSRPKVFRIIRGTYPLAGFVSGHDAQSPGSNSRAIRVDSLRGFPINPIYHQPLTYILGWPLWEYLFESQVAKTLRMAVLVDGNPPRGIRACNVPLPMKRQIQEGNKTSLTGIEIVHILKLFIDRYMAKIPAPLHSPAVDTIELPGTHTQSGTVYAKCGATMTEMLTFMALQRVDAIRQGRAIIHEVSHDIESFIWVLCYTSLQENAFKSQDTTRDAVHKYLDYHFGRMDSADVAMSRRVFSSILTSDGLSLLLSKPVEELLKSLHNRLNQSLSTDSHNLITYEMVTAAIDQAISSISKKDLPSTPPVFANTTTSREFNTRAFLKSFGLESAEVFTAGVISATTTEIIQGSLKRLTDIIKKSMVTPRSATSPEWTHAIELLQLQDDGLTVEEIVEFIDRFAADHALARTYMALTDAPLRRGWMKSLLGSPDGA